MPRQYQGFPGPSSSWTKAVDQVIAQRSATARQYGQDETTRDRNNKVSPFTPRGLAGRLIGEYALALNLGKAIADNKPGDVTRRYENLTAGLLANLATVQADVDSGSSPNISGPASKMLWDTLVRAAIALDGLGVVPDWLDILADAVIESIIELPATISGALDLPKFPVIVIGLVALVLLVVMVKK